MEAVTGMEKEANLLLLKKRCSSSGRAVGWGPRLPSVAGGPAVLTRMVLGDAGHAVTGGRVAEGILGIFKESVSFLFL